MTDMDKEKDIEHPVESTTEKVSAAPRDKKIAVWIAVLLAVVAWVVLLWGNGYVALGVALVACVAGFWGAAGNENAMRRLATAAIIAAMVLVVVLAAFLVVLKIGLG